MAKEKKHLNTCIFYGDDNNSTKSELIILNFVHELSFNFGFLTSSSFRLLLITNGKGHFDTLNTSHCIKKGDVILIFPAIVYNIVDDDNLHAIYISFLGLRVYHILEQFQIEKQNNIFPNHQELIPIFKQCLSKNKSSSIMIEGLLLYVLPQLKEMEINLDNTTSKSEKIAQYLKKVIDDNYNNPELSLNKLSELSHYNNKYISLLFSSYFGISISNYVMNLRINNATRLMNNGFTSIKEIATLCGYKDSLYFSKVFKKIVGSSPTEYMENKEINNLLE